MEDNWISIKDELPKGNEIPVWVYGKLAIRHFYGQAVWISNMFIDTNDQDKMKKVTHWMYTTSPPKE